MLWVLWTLTWLNNYMKVGKVAHVKYLFLKKWAISGLFFSLFLVFSNKQYIFTTNQCWKMSIQYPVLGFEPTTSWTRVTSHNGKVDQFVWCFRRKINHTWAKNMFRFKARAFVIASTPTNFYWINHCRCHAEPTNERTNAAKCLNNEWPKIGDIFCKLVF